VSGIRWIRTNTASIILGCVGKGWIRIEGKPQIIRTLVLSEQNEYSSVGWILCSYNRILNNDRVMAVVSVNVAKHSKLKYKQDIIKNKLARLIRTLLCIISAIFMFWGINYRFRRSVMKIQGDQKVSVHLMVTVQKNMQKRWPSQNTFGV
jgi:hypothetical protein